MTTITANWIDETTGGEAAHIDPSRGYYEARLVSGERITSAERFGPLGDVWHADDDHGGGFEIDSDEFHAAAIILVGGPRDGETVA